jgi:alpha-beta hydrolase superfamily lysophospholipase
LANQKWDLIIDKTGSLPTLSYRLYKSTNIDSKIYAIILPGYGNHVDLHDEMCNHLANSEITTMCLNLEGHGSSFGNRFSVNSFDDYSSNIKRAIMTLKLDCNIITNENFDLTLIGHSHGGLASHYYKELADKNNDVKSLVLACPFYGIKDPGDLINMIISNKFVLNTLNFILPNHIFNTGGTTESVCDNNNWIIKFKNDWLSQGNLINVPGGGVATPSWFKASKNAQDYLITNAKTLTPILFISVTDDQVIDKWLITNMFTKLNNKNSIQKEFTGKHNLFWCNESYNIFNEIISFIKK